ncbi:hypothetical protein ABZ883_41135 [Streptomyces sp. NPDC046977]|uniref:hypothetical protein n=1 Tax=Streptomyces sp. NPDC046977 TaxID=3154703 RepID=UPI0033DD1DBA
MDEFHCCRRLDDFGGVPVTEVCGKECHRGPEAFAAGSKQVLHRGLQLGLMMLCSVPQDGFDRRQLRLDVFFEYGMLESVPARYSCRHGLFGVSHGEGMGP